ncbi:hypothetical protein U0070_022704 [Myodes glareolus]|uniref:Uncharacterized protein n=1 Tax=Myodes glareolus TaxID=447135 RepID=A0AAW0J7G9_MYOGA
MLGARPAIGCARAGDSSRSAEGVVTRCGARGFRSCGALRKQRQEDQEEHEQVSIAEDETICSPKSGAGKFL